MLHIKSSNLQDLIVYVNLLNTICGLPRSPQQTCYAVPFGNLAAKASPLDPAARWALDISIDQPTWDDPGLWYTPTQLAALDPASPYYLPFPVGSDPTWQWEQTDPEWVNQTVIV